MVISMPIHSKEAMEILIKEVLEMQKDLTSFLKSKSDNPAVVALALHTACALVLDDQEDGSQVSKTFDEMADRLSTVVALGYESVLRSLREGSYDRVFAVSVEIGAVDGVSSERCPNCDSEYEEEEPSVEEFDLN